MGKIDRPLEIRTENAIHVILAKVNLAWASINLATIGTNMEINVFTREPPIVVHFVDNNKFYDAHDKFLMTVNI